MVGAYQINSMCIPFSSKRVSVVVRAYLMWYEDASRWWLGAASLGLSPGGPNTAGCGTCLQRCGPAIGEGSVVQINLGRCPHVSR